MARRQVLGRGLASLIADDIEPGAGSGDGQVTEVDIDLVDPGPFQPRTRFDDRSLAELAASIRASGVLQPLVVRGSRGRYEVICGERRLRAARIAGLTRVPVIIRDATDSEALELALVENVQRDDLNPIDLAMAFERLQEEFGYTQEEVAARVSMDRSTVANHLRLLRLPEEARALVAEGTVSMGHARALLALEEAALLDALRVVVEKKLSVRETERLVQKLKRAGQPRGTSRVEGRGEVDVELTSVEQRLQRRFQTLVRIRRTKEGGGEIRIRYYSREELNRILDLMPVE